MKTALIAIDFINDIVDESGKAATAAKQVKARNVLKYVNEALDYARNQGWLVILVKVGFSPSYQEQPKQSPMFGKANEYDVLKLGERGTEFQESLQVEPSDLVITKPRISAFYGTPLEAALRANKIERVVLCGVSSAWAVQSTARDAHDRDYEVVVLEDASAASEAEEHSTSMKLLSKIAKIVSVDQLKAA